MSLSSALGRWDKKRVETFSKGSVNVAKQINDWAKGKKVAVIGLDKAGRLAVFSVNEALSAMGNRPNKTLFMNMSYGDIGETFYQKTKPMSKKEYDARKKVDKFRIAPGNAPAEGWKATELEDATFFVSRYVKQHAPELKKYDRIVILDDWAFEGRTARMMKEAVSLAIPKAEVKTAAVGSFSRKPRVDFHGGKSNWYALETDSVAPIREKRGLFYIRGPGKRAYLVKKPVTTAFPERGREWNSWRKTVRSNIRRLV